MATFLANEKGDYSVKPISNFNAQMLISQNPQQIANAYQNLASDLAITPNSATVTSSASLLPEVARDVQQVKVSGDPINPAEDVKKVLNGLSNNGTAYGRSGYSASAPSADAQLMNSSFQDYMKMIQEVTDKNNAWSAEQAQKQMDFQERMARNSHRYEMEDLKAAGLNPVLTTGNGSGAATPSGAMAQPDTSNSRAITELGLQSLMSLGNSAVSLADGYHSSASNNFKDKLLNVATKYFVPTLVRGVASGIVKSIF